MSLLAAFDRMIEADERASQIRVLAEMIVDANGVDRARCGSCYFWMKSRDCPREHNVGGMSRGPSADAQVCQKFQITQSTIDLKAKRQGEANAYAREYGFPLPFPDTEQTP